MVVDPRQASDVETVAGPCDGNVGEPGFSVINGPGKGLALVVMPFTAVLWRGEVVSDSHARPFAPLRLVRGGNGHFGCAFVVELVDGPEEGAGAVGVDEVDEWLEVAAGRVVAGVVLQFAPGREEDEFGVGRAAAL